MIRKGIYHNEYMDSWQRFNEISLPDKKEFYSNLDIEDITYFDFKKAKKWFGKILNQKILMIIMICTFKGIYYYWWCIWRLWQQMHWNIWTWSCSLSVSAGISTASMFEKDGNSTRIINRYWYATNGRKRD